ncbi:MAG TPA: crossover junction endodeoxyribonuclease RuvC [Succinivibrionaceae bacterium]|nr:crossover junction endodeoxyribonuclease RuvC [Succinivibrionaceae bacterium]
MQTVIGIDPGSRITGYGIVRMQQGQLAYLGSGCIRTGDGTLAEKLRIIYTGVTTLIEQFSPTCMAIEETFLSKNVQSTVKLSEARASAIVAGAVASLEVYEYTPRQIKQAVVGYGAAEKTQVQYMVRNILHLTANPQTDAADALACAICHCFTCSVTMAMGDEVADSGSVRGRLQHS